MNIYLQTLGCDKNTADSRNIAGLLAGEGHTMTADPLQAQVLIINTCAFIQDAKEESIDAILALDLNKKPGQKLIVCGCLTQRYADELARLIPEGDFFLGVNDYDRLPELLSLESPGQGLWAGSVREGSDAFWAGPLEKSLWTAPLKISEGCDRACSYCSIPAIRGPYRSRPADRLLEEAERLADSGCKELVIVAQDVTAYGSDLPGKGHLVALLRQLCAIDGLRWIRLMYCYEDRITDELMDVIAEESKICKYLDLPLQHSCDAILQSMNRHSTAASMKKTIQNLRQRVPGITLRTTLIVGYPGETQADFLELLQFVKDTAFDRLGVFCYSREEGTPAAELPDQVPGHIKERRKDQVMELQRSISLELNRKKIGTTLEVLVEEAEGDGCYLGRTAADAPEIDNGVLLTAQRPLQPGDFVQVLVEDAYDYDLVGTAIEEVAG